MANPVRLPVLEGERLKLYPAKGGVVLRADALLRGIRQMFLTASEEKGQT
ncbi:MAG: hypothetical protein K6U75_01650 [Firmicutes bacterium]|nr:hypothetical protein [Bacillota bacterium]